MTKLIYPAPNEVVTTHTGIQSEFIEKIGKHGTDAALQWLLPIKSGSHIA